MRIIDSLYYKEISKIKRQTELMISTLIDNKTEESVLSIRDVASLFIINRDNIRSPKFNDNDYELIKEILSVFFEDHTQTKTFKLSELKRILNYAFDGRVSDEVNKNLVIKLAELHNEEFVDDEFNLIDIDILNNICDNIDAQ